MRDLLLAFFWMAAVPLSFLSPAAGVSFWVWDALLSPTELVYSFMVSVPTNKLAAFATLFGIFSKPKEWDYYLDKLGVLLILLGICTTISWISAITSLDADTELYLKVIKEIVLAFVLMYLLKTQRWMHVCALLVVISISFLGVKEGLISLLTVGGHKIIGSRAIGDNNQLAAALVVVVPLLMFSYKQVESRTIRNGLLVALVLNVITVMMTLSRGGFIGLLCLAFLYLTSSKQRVRAILVMASFALILYMVAPEAWFTRVDTINEATDDSSFMGRVIAWKISWLIAEDNPLFGGGMHAVQHGPVWFRYSLQLPKLAWIPTPPPDINPHAAHSLIFEVLGDLGFVGLGIYALLFATSYIYLGKTLRLCRNRPELNWVSDLAQSIKFSLILYFITGLLLSVAYFELLFILFAFSSRCLRTARLTNVVVAESTTVAKFKPQLHAIGGATPSMSDTLRSRRRRTML